LRPPKWAFFVLAWKACAESLMVKAVIRAWLLAVAVWAPLDHAEAAQSLVQAQACVLETTHCRPMATTLPYFWDDLHPGRPGRAEFVIKFTRPSGSLGALALYLQRMGNGYELSLNGEVLARSIEWDLPNGADAAKAPVLLNLPAGLLRENNELKISLRADVARRAGLSAPYLGTAEEVWPRYRWDYRWRVLGVEFGATLTGLVALLAWAMWIIRPRPPALSALNQSVPALDSNERDPAYLYAAVAMSGWCVFFCDSAIEAPLLAWPFWGLVVAVGFALGVCAMTLFCQDIAGLETRRSRWLMLTVGMLGALSAAATLWLGWWAAWVIWLGLLVVAYTIYGFYYGWHCWRAPSTARLLLALAVLINVLGGAWDWVTVLRDGDLYGDNTYGHYLPILYALTLGFILLQRFHRASLIADQLTHSMARQVQAKSAQLEASYQSMEGLARAQARSAERASILRDMHDGVGAHIASAIRQLQSGKAERSQVLTTLNESLDQLKLTIDAMKLAPGDVAGLLADLRYRLEPRLNASDLTLSWQVQLVPPILRLDSEALRQLQYVVYEALSNVMQHAKAHLVIISLEEDAQAVVLSIVDDGRGFEVGTSGLRGLHAMRQRCEAIGTQLLVSSAPGTTCVKILIPRLV
jgi:signal transduction histidine kinase